MYFKITYRNAFCGCEEEHYIEAESEIEADKILADGMDSYDFYWPDNRFVDPRDYGTTEEYDEAVDEYMAEIAMNSTCEEITKEEYEENKNED